MVQSINFTNAGADLQLMYMDNAAVTLSDRFIPAGDKTSFIDFSKHFQALQYSLINFFQLMQIQPILSSVQIILILHLKCKITTVFYLLCSAKLLTDFLIHGSFLFSTTSRFTVSQRNSLFLFQTISNNLRFCYNEQKFLSC